MLSVPYLILSSLWFQAVWFLCVYAIYPWSIVAALVLVVIHLAIVPERTKAALIIVAAALFGLAADSIQVAAGLIAFEERSLGLIPLWLVVLWVAFGTLITGCLQWLMAKPWLAVLLGAIMGPFSYQSATWLVGTVQISFAGLVSLAISWGAAMYLFYYLDKRLSDRDSQAETGAVTPSRS